MEIKRNKDGTVTLTPKCDGICCELYRAINTLAEQKAEIERLREALRFYADESLYRWQPVDGGRETQMSAITDNGAMARAALEVK